MLKALPGKKPAVQDAPSAAAIHILLDSGLLHLKDGMLVLDSGGPTTAPMRIGEIAQVSLHGEAGITTPALRVLMKEGIPVLFRARNGYYAGQTIDLSGTHSAVRRSQYRAAEDPAQALCLARALVHAKIQNARTVLRRREWDPAAQDSIGLLAQRALYASELDMLRGIEGAAAAAYFAAVARLLGARTSFRFQGRSRRPPRDPFNALLSYLYAIMTGECAAAALAAGLDPDVGFLHVERPGRPALALDLVEPLRPLICDSVALGLVRRREIAPGDFTGDAQSGWRLSDAARRVVIAGLERRLGQSFQRLSDVRAAIAADAKSLAAALRGGCAYQPLLMTDQP